MLVNFILGASLLQWVTHDPSPPQILPSVSSLPIPHPHQPASSSARDVGQPQIGWLVGSGPSSQLAGPRLWWLTSVSRLVLSRKVLLHDLCRVSVSSECREVTVKKKRVETYTVSCRIIHIGM